MVDKWSSPTPKITVLDCLKPSTLSAVGNDNRILRNKFVVGLQMPEGTLLIVKCPAPGTHRKTNARGDAHGWN